ncbi:MAG: Crp/Fnr family transcriptional regulator, partial [Burkholderiales bacterium]
MPRPTIPIEAFVESLPLFKTLRHEEIQRVAESVTQINAERGSVLFRRGDPCTGFHALLYGQVKLSLRGSSGAEKVLEVLGPGQTFGEAVMFLEKPYHVEAQTLVDSKLLFIPREIVFAEIEADPGFARRLLASLSVRLHRLVYDLESCALMSGRERVVGYLLSMVPEGKNEGGHCFPLTIKKGVIASKLNVSQEHFSRILQELAHSGLISVD